MDGRPDGEILQDYEGIIREEDMLTAIDAIILSVEDAEHILRLIQEQIHTPISNAKQWVAYYELKRSVENIKEIREKLYSLD